MQVAWNSAEISGEEVVPHHFQTNALKGQKMKVCLTHPARQQPVKQSTPGKALECEVKRRVIITEIVKSS